MTENIERIGSFTSSEIYKLATTGKGEYGFGAKALTYIDEKRIENKMKRSISTDSYSQAMAWGIFCEMYVFSLIGIEYQISSQETDVHPTISQWSGSKDLIVPDVKISDIKCFQPKKFAQYTDALIEGDLKKIKEDFPAEYYQLVSNAIINGVNEAEAITFMPYESELENLREMAENYEGEDQWKYRFIAENKKASLPYLPDDGYYSNLNTFSFIVPQEDKDFLTERVEKAIELLNK